MNRAAACRLVKTGVADPAATVSRDAPTDRPLRRKVTIGFIAAAVLTGLLGLLSWRDARRTTEDADWVAHTHEVAATLELTLRHLLDVETGGRGFAMAGDEKFLEPYETGRTAIGQDLQRLSVLMADNSKQLRQLDLLRGQAKARIEATEELIAIRRNSRTAATDLEVQKGKKVMDAARLSVAQMEAEEKKLLDQRTERLRATNRFTSSVIAFGSVLGVVFLTVSGFTVSREIGVSARARAQVNALNVELEQRVAQRTEALGESEGRLAGVIQSAMDAILTVDEQQNLLLFNAAAERMFGCPAAEALGQPLARFIPQRFHAAHAGHIHKFADTGVTSRAMGSKNVLWAVRTDGQEFQIEASISQVITSGKKLFTVILRDVTERVQAEAVREHLAAVVDSSDDAIISKDLSGIINAWNRGAEKIFGYPAAEAVGKPMTMLMPPDRVNEEPAILTRIQRGESVEHFETVRVRKDGTKIDVSVTISPIRDVNGAIVGASKITRDITERKRAEEALQEQAQIMDSAQVFVRDMHSRVVFWPKGAEKLYGFTRQEAVGVLSHDLFDTKFPESLEMVEKKLFETGMWEGELIHTRRDGSIIVVSSAWVLHRDKQGQPIRILETNIDITARKRAEESLRDSEERFLAMANGIPQLAWMAEADGNIFWYNKRFYEYTGTTLEQMKGWGWEKVHDPEVLPKVLEGWREAIAAGTPFEMEFPLRGADGKFGAFLTRIVPVKDAAGRVTRWFGTNTDIGEIKQAQGQLAGQAKELSQQAKDLVRSGESLEAQSTMLNLVLENMAEGLVAADLEGHFLIWNDAARRLMGRDALELPSHQWTDRYQMFLPDGVTPYPTESLPLVRALRGESTLQEMVVRHSAEPEIFLEVTARPMKDRKGNFCGGVVVFRDITKRRSDELEIRKLNEELEERVVQRTAQLEVANHELEAFTYSVSHDLRAPLRHIGGYSKILSEDFGSAMPAEAQSHVKRIEDGVDRMVLLVDELLNLARVGRRALKLRSTNLNWVIEEVVSLLQPEAEGRQVTWKIAELPAAECDPVLVKQVFQNLIANALKFTRTRERAVVEISQRQENGQMVIVICDNGVGFNMKYQDKLFGVFQRLHRDEDFEGTGIGLATVKRIVHKHGGRVWAEAELDKGATFYFTLGAESADVKTKEDKNKAATA